MGLAPSMLVQKDPSTASSWRTPSAVTTVPHSVESSAARSAIGMFAIQFRICLETMLKRPGSRLFTSSMSPEKVLSNAAALGAVRRTLWIASDGSNCLERSKR